jgi:hypothetical protein
MQAVSLQRSTVSGIEGSVEIGLRILLGGLGELIS